MDDQMPKLNMEGDLPDLSAAFLRGPEPEAFREDTTAREINRQWDRLVTDLEGELARARSEVSTFRQEWGASRAQVELLEEERQSWGILTAAAAILALLAGVLLGVLAS